LLSAFYYSYVLAMAPVGWLGERYGAHRVLGVGVAIWSVSTLLTGFAATFVSLLLLRLMLGLGESAGFPCSSKLVAVAVEPARIGTANGMMAFGYLIGPALGTVLGGTLMSHVGWRPVFVLFGALSLLWLWPWSRVRVAEPALRTREQAPAGPTFVQILRKRGLWGAALGHFSSNYNYYFILAWLPLYLVKVRGFSMQSMANVAGFAYLINAFAGLFSGWATDAWIRTGLGERHLQVDDGAQSRRFDRGDGRHGTAAVARLRGVSVRLPGRGRSFLARCVRDSADPGGSDRRGPLGRCAKYVRQCRWNSRASAHRYPGGCYGQLHERVRACRAHQCARARGLDMDPAADRTAALGSAPRRARIALGVASPRECRGYSKASARTSSITT